MINYLEFKKFLVDNWIKPHYPSDTDVQVAIEEYKRCKRISDDEYSRWVNYERNI